MTGVPARELKDEALERELEHLHETRHDTFLHGSEDALAFHSTRTSELEADYLRANAGTDRIEANGRLALRPTISGYPFPVGSTLQLEFVLAVRFIDNRGNVVETSRRVPLV